MRTIAAVLLTGVFVAPHVALSQRISLGVVGGSAVTNDYSGSGTTQVTDTGYTVTNTRTTSAHQLIIGPKIEVRLTNRVSFDVNALRRQSEWRSRSDFDPPLSFNGDSIPTLSEVSTDVTWEVPLLIKYRFPALKTFGGIHPFIAAGPSVHPWVYAQGDPRIGMTAGAGFRIPFQHVNIEPMIRYTRWTTPGIYSHVKQDQLELLVGVAGLPSSGRPGVLGKQLRFGFIGGFGLSGDFQAEGAYPSALSKMAGLTIGTAVTDRWSIEVEAMYRPRMLSEQQRATVLTWEFPVVARYNLTAGRVSPFVEAGPAFRSAGNTNNSNPSRFGATGGVGVLARWRGVHFSPRIRYTHWAADPPNAHLYLPDIPLQQPFSRRNQIDALVGFSF